MRYLKLILCFGLSCAGLIHAQPSLSSYKTSTDQLARLQLSANIIEQQYCSDEDGTTLSLVLRLNYANTGTIPVLLDKRKPVIGKIMVSSNLEALAKQEYEYNPSFYFDLPRLGFDPRITPKESSFVTLRPGESFSIDTNIGLPLYDGTEDTEDDLRAGNHILQVVAWTWHYLNRPLAYREQWRNQGYLWSESLTSIPTPFTVEEQREFVKCSK